jgi:hypothetical protein
LSGWKGRSRDLDSRLSFSSLLQNLYDTTWNLSMLRDRAFLFPAEGLPIEMLSRYELTLDFGEYRWSGN